MTDFVVVEAEAGEISFPNGGRSDFQTALPHEMADRSKLPFTITVSDVSREQPELEPGFIGDHRDDSHFSSLRGGPTSLLVERSASPYDPSRDHSRSPGLSASPGASSNQSFPSYDWETLDPESNLYIANFPNDYGEENLRRLFSSYGPIARAKFVPVQGQRAYGFVQFVNVEDSHRSLKEMDGYRLESGEQLFMSVALRKRSSLSEEPTNLYVKNIPHTWTYHELNVLFGPFGRIVQSRVAGDRIAFVRYETHYQAIQAIDSLNGRTIDGASAPLEVKFANRKRAVKEYNNPTPVHKSNSNNLYVRGLPPSFAQIQLEELFGVYGTVSSTRMFPNGVAFVRFADRESALNAIQNLHNQIISGCTTPLTVKLAYFDIGDSRNRTWKNQSPSETEPRERPARNGHALHGRPDHHHHHQSKDRMLTGTFSKNVFQQHLQGQQSYGRQSGPGGAPPAQVAQYPMGPIQAGPFSGMNGIPTAASLAHPYTQLAVVPPIPISTSPGLGVPTIVSPPSPGALGTLVPTLSSSPISPHQPQVLHAIPVSSPARQHSHPSGVIQAQSPYAIDTSLMHFAAAPTVITSGAAIFGSQPIVSPMSSVPATVFLSPTTVAPNSSSPHAQVPSPQSTAHSGSTTPSRAPTIPATSLGTTVVQQQTQQFSQQQRRQGDIIYQIISEKYPKYASKVTGMILNLGVGEAERLLVHRAELDRKVEEAVRILQAVEQQKSIRVLSGGAGLAGEPTVLSTGVATYQQS